MRYTNSLVITQKSKFKKAMEAVARSKCTVYPLLSYSPPLETGRPLWGVHGAYQRSLYLLQPYCYFDAKAKYKVNVTLFSCVFYVKVNFFPKILQSSFHQNSCESSAELWGQTNRLVAWMDWNRQGKVDWYFHAPILYNFYLFVFFIWSISFWGIDNALLFADFGLQ